jgi:preprotein translocase SecE subunit
MGDLLDPFEVQNNLANHPKCPILLTYALQGFFSKQIMNAISNYINNALEELRHVRWPTRQQAIRLSAIVVAFTIGSAAVFGVLDFGLSKALHFLLSLS